VAPPSICTRSGRRRAAHDRGAQAALDVMIFLSVMQIYQMSEYFVIP
jgi:hypothetical protein